MLGKNTFYRGLGTGRTGSVGDPHAELVVVHRADTDHGRTIDSEDHWRLVESILAARRSEPEPKPDLGPLHPTTLSSQLPPATIPEYRALRAALLDDYLGDYKLGPGATHFGDVPVDSRGNGARLPLRREALPAPAGRRGRPNVPSNSRHLHRQGRAGHRDRLRARCGRRSRGRDSHARRSHAHRIQGTPQ